MSDDLLCIFDSLGSLTHSIVDTCLRGIDSILIEVHDAVRLVGRRREITASDRLITAEERLGLVEVS